MKYSYSIFFVLFFCFIGYNAQGQDPCECVGCPIPIQDNSTTFGTLDVTVNGPNDLSQCPLQSICFDIDHTWLGDLSITLTSPNGTNYLIMADNNNNSEGCGSNVDDADICVQIGTNNPLTNNTAYACNGFNPCLQGNWTVPCGGVTDPISGAVEAPNCDLNDFNTPGAPANGTWTVTVNDVCGADTGFLNNFDLTFACGTTSCVICESEGGSIPISPLFACETDAIFNLPPSGQQTDPAYSYAYVISQNDVVVAVNMTPDLTGLGTGIFEVCGINYLNADGGNLATWIGQSLSSLQSSFAGSNDPFCCDFSDNCVNIEITPIPDPIPFDTILCAGDCFFINSLLICTSGSYIDTNTGGCDQQYDVIITEVGPFSSNVILDVCEGECATYNGQIVCPPDPVTVFLTSYQGCDSIVELTFNEITTSASIFPNPPPILDCNSTEVILSATNSIPATGPFEWYDPNGEFIDSSPTINVTEPGDYTLVVFNNAVDPPCGDMTTVTVTQSLNLPSLVQIGNPEICAGGDIDLSGFVFDSNGNSVITFHTNTPATPSNQLPSSIVSPTVQTTYFVLGSDGDCTDEIPLTVNIVPAPNADFVADSPICITETSTIQYIGTASPNAIYTWDFAGGFAIPGTGQGPHNVSFATPGLYTVTLTVEENGCTSDPFSVNILVEESLTPPVISCDDITTNSITFNWADIPGASGYDFIVVTGQNATMLSNTSYLVDNLAPDETVTVTVVALSNNSCDLQTSSITCTTNDCLPVTIIINPVDDICLDANADQVFLTVTTTGGTGNGSGTFSGPGIIDPIAGVFDPNLANIGVNTITYDYIEGDCDYSGSLDILVNDVPTSDFTVTGPACVGDDVLVTYTGNADSGDNFIWNFGGGSPNPGIGIGPHTVTFGNGGIQTISLTVEADDCFSTTTEQTVEILEPLPAPVINCNPTINSIEFTWADILGAGSYDVVVVTGQSGTQSGNTFTVTGLVPNEEVTIEVTVNGNAPCPPSSATLTCFAQDCEDVEITIDPVGDICLDGNQASFDITATTDDSTPTGTLTFSGPGIINTNAGTFDPDAANTGANNITVTYVEGNCSYNNSIIIQVIQSPTSDFTVTSPICVDDATTVAYTGSSSSSDTFVWDFDGGTATPGTGAGPHQVTWTASGTYTITLSVEGAVCSSDISTQEVQVDPLLDPIVIDCETTLNSVTFTWNFDPNVLNYDVVGSAGTQVDDTTYTVTGLNPGDDATITVTAISQNACNDVSATQTCTAQDCDEITITIDPVANICLDANALPFDIITTTDDATPTGSFEFSGPGITDATAGTFDPNAANIGTNTILVVYTEDDCTYNESIDIEVIATPTADFTLDNVICIDQSTTVNYEGTATTGATFQWDFDGGTATPGTGIGPHDISWSNPGTYTVGLIVEENGCASTLFEQIVTVDPVLSAPFVECNPTINSVTFFWDAVDNATGYDVVVNTGQAGVMISDTSFVVDGLTVGTTVEITVTANTDSACGPVSVTAECTALDCPTATVEIAPVTPICLTPDDVAQDLMVTVTGSPNCTGTWSGPGITDVVNGTFDPAIAGVGQHNITFECVDGPCSYADQITIEVLPVAIASFGMDAEVCLNTPTTITFSGSNVSPSAVYTWDFGGATALPGGNDPGPHTLTWSTTGTQTVSLSVEQDGCESELFSANIDVIAPLDVPVIQCNTTTESIEFIWNTVSGATDYTVNLISGLAGTSTSDTTYLVTGLNPLDEVTIEVVVGGNGPCPAVSTMATCSAVDCPDVIITVDEIGPFCLENGLGDQPLTANVQGGGSTGTNTWSGPGINNPNQGIFDPQSAGVGNHQIVYTYQEGPCSYSESINIAVVAPPVADAGEDQTLICDSSGNDTTLGGSGTSIGDNIIYLWTTANGTSFPGDSTIANPVVNVAGTYILTVTNTDLGCSATSSVQIDSDQGLPIVFPSSSDVSCFGDGNGFISIDSVANGTPPYLFSFNGGPFSSTSIFTNLSAGAYSLIVQDANGCEQAFNVAIDEPEELGVEIVTGEIDPQIELGEDITLTIRPTPTPFDSLDFVSWMPAEAVDCDTCQQNTIMPQVTTVYEVMIQEGDCIASDQITVFVSKDLEIFMPNVFSPNGDGENEKVFPQAKDNIVAVYDSYMVFNRWGEIVHQSFGFSPFDVEFAWDGTKDGTPLDPQVFVWFIEVTFIDGTKKIFEGDITLIK